MKMADKDLEEVENTEELEADVDTEDIDKELEEQDSDAEESKEDSEEDSEGEEADGSEENSSEKKGFFGKKKEKKDKKTQQIEDLTDQLKRTMAEFDNFRKRTDKEKAGMYEGGQRGVIEKLLPVVDNFERAFKDITEEQMSDPFVDGMDKVFKQIMTVFEELGVKAIEAEGAEFNPDFHNAVMHVEDDSFEENIIAEEFQKGYTFNDTVIRHSMVKVAN